MATSPIATPFNTTVGTTSVTAFTVTGLAAGANTNYGVLVVTPSSASGNIYYGVVTGLTTSANSVLIPNGVPVTIPKAFYGGDLANLFFIADTAAQAISGYAL